MYPKRGPWVQDILATCEDPAAALTAWMIEMWPLPGGLRRRQPLWAFPVHWVDGSQDIPALGGMVATHLGLAL